MLHWDQNSIEAYREQWTEREKRAMRSPKILAFEDSAEHSRNEALASGFIWGIVLATFLTWTSGGPLQKQPSAKRNPPPELRVQRVPAEKKIQPELRPANQTEPRIELNRGKP